MALKAVLDNIDDAPEAVRDHYTEQEGKYVLTVEPVGGYALEDVSGLKSALGKERTARETLERDVVRYKDIDPDKARTALAELEELKKIDPASEADKIANTKFEAAKSQLLEKHQGEVGQRDDRIKFLTGTVDDLVRQQRATAAIAEAKGSVDLLLPHVLKYTRTVEKEGRFAVDVVDADGNVRISNAKGDPMSIKDLVAEMRQTETFSRAFDGEGHSGTGKTHDNPGGGTRKGDFGGSKEERQAAIASKFNLKD